MLEDIEIYVREFVTDGMSRIEALDTAIQLWIEFSMEELMLDIEEALS